MNLRRAKRSEDTEQIMVIEWAGWNKGRFPELELLYHCPNGGSRNRAEAVKLKQMGVKAGVPDLCLPVPKGIYAGLYIEMKYDGGRVQESQKEFLKLASDYGHYCVVCYGAETAIKILGEYMQLKTIDTGLRENTMKIPNLSVIREGKVKELCG